MKNPRKELTVFLPCSDPQKPPDLAAELLASEHVDRVVLVVPKRHRGPSNDFAQISSGTLTSSETMGKVAAKTRTRFTMLILQEAGVSFARFGLKRFVDIGETTGAGLVYSDYQDVTGDERVAHPLIDYQPGSLRDDFDFGQVILFRSSALTAAVKSTARTQYKSGGLYAVRLALSRKSTVFHIAEQLYSRIQADTRTGGEKQFEYLDRHSEDVQLEMERVVTQHLKAIKAYVPPGGLEVDLTEGTFPVDVSVVIPVRNREATIAAAVASALRQEGPFQFNVIVVDNHSTDRTTAIVHNLARTEPRLIHVVPEEFGLGIGGCWNEALFNPACGRFVVQLDSDDIYADGTTLRRMVETFHAENCAMVVGSYRLTDFQFTPIPPEIIDHREWTKKNGRNNVLRVNGFGAPRAFFTPVLRQNPFPDVSYGEDYAVGLTISRDYHVGRIADPIYICRRWEGNSDARLDAVAQNAHDYYKDTLRSLEIRARQSRTAGRSRGR